MNKTVETTVEVTQNEEGTWLNVHNEDGEQTISLSRSPGQNIHDFFQRHVLEKAQPARQKLGHWSKRSAAYVSGAFALAVVAVSAIAALFYAATHTSETLSNLASSTLSGVGMAIGGCIGSALILRFKTARKYLRSVLKDLQ